MRVTVKVMFFEPLFPSVTLASATESRGSPSSSMMVAVALELDNVALVGLERVA